MRSIISSILICSTLLTQISAYYFNNGTCMCSCPCACSEDHGDRLLAVAGSSLPNASPFFVLVIWSYLAYILN